MDKRLRTWNPYSRGAEERARENPTVQLIEKCNSLRFNKKTNMKFPWVLVFDLEIG